MSLIITGATIIDGVAEKPIRGHSLWIENGRIKAIARRDELGAPPHVNVVDARGKYLIPGLMNANVHLLIDMRFENLVRHAGRYDDLIAEAAQIALRNGVTTVFDTVGMRAHLISVRDKINSGKLPGSRIFCAGWLIGMDGPISGDLYPGAASVASPAFTKRINAVCAENVGRHLMWLPPEEVVEHVRTYMAKGVDFIKFCSNDHCQGAYGAFLAFSPRVQAAMVQEAHRAGTTAQAHTTSIEGLLVAIEAGCDIVQHANHTGPVPIPQSTLELFSSRRVGTVVFPNTQQQVDWFIKHATFRPRAMWEAMDLNARNFVRSGAFLLLGTDGGVFPPEWAKDPSLTQYLGEREEDWLMSLAAGHFYWLRAMEEKECPPMEMLRAATRNIAVAYGKEKDLGTLEAGKIADLLILDENPLEAAKNYQSIYMIIKDGAIVDRDSLPLNPILTRPMEHAEEEACYVPFLFGGGNGPPCC